MIASPLKDSLFAEHDALTQATASSPAGRIAFGRRAGEYVRWMGGGFGVRTLRAWAVACLPTSTVALHDQRDAQLAG